MKDIKPPKPTYESSSSSDDSSASDENDDTDEGFYHSAVKGRDFFHEFGKIEVKLNTVPALFQGNLERLQTLLKGRSIDTQDMEGNTVLIRATEHGHEKMVEWLLQNGASVKYCD